jgi:LmbE family N-acetylglucosaminyl deacetylase
MLGPVDVLVLAPHPDDEVIGCGGVIQQSLKAGRRVRIAFMTSGDGYPQAASVLLGKPVDALRREDFVRLGQAREAEAIAAARVLGLYEGDLVFLRYPDALLGSLTAEARAAAMRDVRQVLGESAPAQVYVTGRADEHPDHRATNELVGEAVASLGYGGELLTYIVHSGGDVHWPLPGPRFETSSFDGVTYPEGVEWPPPIRVPLTARESELKLLALVAHASQWDVDHDYLGRFVKSEEIFWPS